MFLRTARGQWMGTSSASRVRGATRPHLGTITLGRAGRLDRAAGAGSQCARLDARIWSCPVSVASLVPSQWEGRCSPPWVRWPRRHRGHKSVLCRQPSHMSLVSLMSAHPTFFLRPVHFTGPPFFFHTSLRVPPTFVSVTNPPDITSQSVGLSVYSLTCCSYSLCVCFHYFPSSHGSHLVSFFSVMLYFVDKDDKFPP